MLSFKKSLVTAFGFGLLAAGSTFAAPGQITSQLEIEQSWLTNKDDVYVRFTLSNEGSEKVSVLKWQTPFEGIDDDLFTVARNGEPVTYLGRHIKRAAPTAADFLVIEPGKSISAMVELTRYYDMSVTGEYTIVYDQTLQSTTSRLNATTSNVVALWIEGNDAVEPIAEAADNDINTRALTPTYVGCSSSQQASIVSALSSAETYAINAYNHLQARTTTTLRNGSLRYKTWFGTYTSSRWTTAQSHFLNIRNTIQNQTLNFNCGCTQNYYAYVYSNSPYTIYLCNLFWSAPATGTDSKAGTIVHELSHFNVVAATDDWAYGQAACKTLATNNPTNAVDNADSHEYFAENTPNLDRLQAVCQVQSIWHPCCSQTGGGYYEYWVSAANSLPGAHPIASYSWTNSGYPAGTAVNYGPLFPGLPGQASSYTLTVVVTDTSGATSSATCYVP